MAGWSSRSWIWHPHPLPIHKLVPTKLSPPASRYTLPPFPNTRPVTRLKRLINSPRGQPRSPSTTAYLSRRRPLWSRTHWEAPSSGALWRWSHPWSLWVLCQAASIPNPFPMAEKPLSPFYTHQCLHFRPHSAHIHECGTQRSWMCLWICLCVRMGLQVWGWLPATQLCIQLCWGRGRTGLAGGEASGLQGLIRLTSDPLNSPLIN